jgi:S1-C subfamily serine protease
VLQLNLNEIARSSMSIPVDFYRDNAEELLRYGRVVSRPKRAWLGVYAHALEDGVMIAGLVAGGPADKGGIREGDMIVSLNAEELSSRRDFYMSLWRHAPGDRLTFEVMRDNSVRRLELTGGDRGEFFKAV